jgi:hypothetical protein
VPIEDELKEEWSRLGEGGSVVYHQRPIIFSFLEKKAKRDDKGQVARERGRE